MRLVFGTLLVVGGLFGTTVLSRLLSRQTREFGVEGGLKALRLIAIAVVPIGALMIVSSGVRMISAGHVGVALLFGKVQPIALHEGINLVNPLYDVIQMDTRVQKHQGRYDAASKDLQAVHVEMVLNYRLTPDKRPRSINASGRPTPASSSIPRRC
jgi:regulator of protease activity HflC (stomatin/prohibitin superfamily)